MTDFQFKGSGQSPYTAETVIKTLLKFIELPSTVLDIGCGIGIWSKTLKDAGVAKTVLVDHPSNKKENLLFSDTEFVNADMNVGFPPVYKSDLVVCVEVAEHLKPERSNALIEYISTCTDTVLFSAAIPGQGGIGHINLHYADYWEKIFIGFGFKRYDILRPAIINDDNVEYFIRQNIFLYERDGGLLKSRNHNNFLPEGFELIHHNVLYKHVSPVQLIKQFPGSLIKSLQNRLQRK